jgi:hypothetical protein
MRIFASCMALAKAARNGSLLAPLGLRNCPGRSCALLRPVLQGGRVQMNPSALQA